MNIEAKKPAKSAKQLISLLWVAVALVTIFNARSMWSDYGTRVFVLGALIPLLIASIAVYVLARRKSQASDRRKKTAANK